MPNPRLLLVDDEPDLTLILGRIARRAGIDLACRADATSAHELLRGTKPNLVLLDVNLPGTSGVELLRRLRAEPDMAGLRVALFCHPGLPEDIAAGWKAGADYLVAKDLIARPDALQGRLAEILAHADGHGVSASLTCPANTTGLTTCDWASSLERILAHVRVRVLGNEVREQVLRRALAEAFSSTQERSTWVQPGEGRFTPDRPGLPRTVARQALWVCFASVSDQLWRLLGSETHAQMLDEVQAAVDRVLL